MIARGITFLIGVLLLGGAFGKAWSIPVFGLTIVHLLPPLGGSLVVVAQSLAALVVIWECWLGVTLIGNLWPRGTILATIVTLLFFSGVLLRIWYDPTVSSCGCHGDLPILRLLDSDPRLGIAQNFLMILGLVFAIGLRQRGTAVAARRI